MLPREHGAWAMLLMAYLVGTAAAGWGGIPSILLLASVLLVFTSSRPLEVALQTIVGARETMGGIEIPRRQRAALVRLGIYLGLAGSAGLFLLLSFQRWALLPVGGVALATLAAQLVLRRRRLDRGWAARLLSIAALSTTGPAAYYAASGVLDRHAVAAGLLAFLYSGASVFYVRLFYRPSGRQRSATGDGARRRAALQLAAYLAFASASAGSLALLQWLPPLAMLTLVPLAAKAAWAFRKESYHPSLRQLGFTEIGHTSLFALLAVVAIATWR